MKILYIAPDLPYPLANGGKIRTFSLLRNVAREHEVTFIAYDKQPDDPTRIGIFQEFCKSATAIPLQKQQTRDEKRKVQMKSILSSKPYQYYASHSSCMQKEIDKALAQEQFDLIHVEFSQLGYHKFPDGIPTFLDQHNVEYDLLHRIYLNEALSLRKLYCYLEWKKFKRDELHICQKFSHCAVTSERDKRLLQEDLPQLPCHVIPNGVDSTYFRVDDVEDAEPNTILFTGTIDYYPNTDGLKYFLESIFPLIQQQIPDIHFIIAGRNPPPAIQQYENQPGITITGFVDDMRTYYRKAQVVVVPLRMGGGTRLKILEAMSMQKPIVSTTVGAEGIDVQSGQNIVLADEPNEFAQAAVELLHNAEKRAGLASAGNQLATTRYDWRAITERLMNAYDTLMLQSKN
ncbi:MAG: glycosyltransferase [Chloroflexota bacterium]